MGYVVKMPKLGMDMDQGTIVEWLVDEGDEVESGQVVAEIESEKTTGEIKVREDGVVHRLLLGVGDSVEPGGDVAVVGGADEDVSGLVEGEAGGEAAASESGETADAAATGGSGDASPQAASLDGPSAVSEGGSASASAESVKATPRAKKRAEELGVDLTTVEGTGPQGAVSEEDVEAAAEGGEEAAAESVKATPRAKKRAEELGVDLTTVEGTGPQGAVSEEDVEAAAESAPTEETEQVAEASAAEGRVFAPPRVRRLARELGVDLAAVEGSGPSGAITEGDVRAAANGESTVEPTAEGEEAAEADVGTRDEERPLSGMRRTIANRLGQSDREAVHVTEHRGADAEELLAAADAADDALGVKVTVNDVLLLALSATLDEHPAFNATFEEEVHRLHRTQDICIAIDIEEGLIAPVVRNVGELSLSELAEKRRAVTEKSLSGEYTMEDLSGGTFTVSNLGVLGVESFDPVINPPQVAILGVNTIKDEVVPVGEDEVGVRKRISFDLSFDHRIVDGADAARFLGSLVEHVENPWPLVIAAGGR
ncbi:dihydrolipoyllysine acetyltransferase [Salinigranum rubrum]|uniref:Dihydrolipoyllysine acetyltransferase n=2 Tax=Salinigranum rubrum TaxID=755307 RepID=A0A2I8VG65_9EURY|nr:dihydrolipoyllysine acetyltransferase [Salinigranum rubrum]